MANVYLDSCVVIYLIQGPPVLHERVSHALKPPQGPPPRLFISDLTRLECRVWPIREGKTPLLNQYDEFFLSDEVTHIPITTGTFDLATEIRARHGLKVADALHLAAAISVGCDVFWTNDQRMATATSGRIQIEVLA